MLKQLEKYLFRQLAFSAFVVAASALFEEVRVGIVVLVLLICLSVPQKWWVVDLQKRLVWPHEGP